MLDLVAFAPDFEFVSLATVGGLLDLVAFAARLLASSMTRAL